MSETPKSTNSLMKYLREVKHIDINGSKQKLELMNVGYYHAYKGYRFIKSPNTPINYTKFEELMAIYNFDSNLKSLFYPWVMFIETSLKSRVLDVVLSEAGTSNFAVIYSDLLDNYKIFDPSHKVFRNSNDQEKAEKKYAGEIRRRLELRSAVYNAQKTSFDHNNKIVEHFTYNDQNIPIWGIFELLTLGDFGKFITCLNEKCRMEISRNLKINPGDDSKALMVQQIVSNIKGLRNSIAHNNVVFDTRFNNSEINRHFCNCISNATKINNVDFKTITDYLILIVYVLKLLGVTKNEMKSLVNSYSELIEKLRREIPINVYNKIVYTNNAGKLKNLVSYVSR